MSHSYSEQSDILRVIRQNQENVLQKNDFENYQKFHILSALQRSPGKTFLMQISKPRLKELVFQWPPNCPDLTPFDFFSGVA